MSVMDIDRGKVSLPTVEVATANKRRRWAAALEYLLIVLGLASLAFVQKHGVKGDGHHRYLQLTELLEHGRLPDGDYSLIGPLFATPLWLAGRATGNPQTWLSFYNLILLTIGLAVAHLLLRKRIDGAVLRRFLLLVVAGSIVGPSVYDFYGEIFTLVCVGCGLIAVSTARRSRTRWTGWAFIVLGVVNTPASIVGLALICGLDAVRRRRFRAMVPLLVAGVIIAVEIALRDGGYSGNAGARTIMPYSGRPGFSYPFVLGLAAILFSFGRGLVWFIPGMFLPAMTRLRTAFGLDVADLHKRWLLFAVGLIAVYMSWWAWHGGMTWGPRFFIIAILPASLVIAVRLGHTGAGWRTDLITFGVLTLSMWGAVTSTVYFGHWPQECYSGTGAEELCHFAPEFSQLWTPILAHPSLNALRIAALVYYCVVFGWLAAPVAVRIARGARPRINTAAFSHWRF